MKRINGSTRLLIGFSVLFLAASSFAANKGSLHVTSPLMVGGTQLSAGDYTVQWDGTGSNLQATIKKDNKIKATVPARLVPLDQTPSGDALVMDTSGGRRSLLEIRFSGKKFMLHIEPQSAAADVRPDEPESR